VKQDERVPQPPPPPPQSASLYAKRAQHFRTMALAASTADAAITLIRLAIHYERLAKEGSASPSPTDDQVPG